jgi:hypothetical protein
MTMFSRPRTRPARLTAALTLAVAAWPATAPAQVVLFFDDFNGPALNPAFQASLPNGAPLGNGNGSNAYLGAPNYSFGTVDGASVLRLTNTLNNWQRVGWSTSSIYAATNFRYEVRFNTLVQSPATSIDSFIETWVIDAADTSRYDIASPHGMNYGTDRQFRAGSSIDGLFYGQQYGYLDNTWYRLVIQGTAGQNVRASIFADDGVTELVGQSFSHTGTAFPNGFRLGLSQAMGAPGSPYPSDVAIDWMRLTTTPVPEASSLLLLAGATAGVVGFWRSHFFVRNLRAPPLQVKLVQKTGSHPVPA